MEQSPFFLIVSISLNILVAVLLIATIWYARKLAKSVDTIRKSRSDISAMISDLGNHIIRAESAISGLKDTARTSGGDLQKTVDKSLELADELLLINEAGSNLADRLEKLSHLATKNSSISFEKSQEAEEYFSDPEIERAVKSAKNKAISRTPTHKERDDSQKQSFAIGDREFHDKKNTGTKTKSMNKATDYDNNMHSQAEKQLYEALIKKTGGRKKP